jgi:PAS domain S-box-containing protein
MWVLLTLAAVTAAWLAARSFYTGDRELFYQAIIERSTDLVFQVLTRDTARVEYINGPTVEILGRQKHEIILKPWGNFIYPEDHELIRAVFAQAEGEPERAFHVPEIRMQKPNGDLSYCEGTVVFLPEWDSFVANWRNVTDRVLTQRQLQAALNAMTEGVKARTEIHRQVLEISAYGGDSGLTKGYRAANGSR